MAKINLKEKIGKPRPPKEKQKEWVFDLGAAVIYVLDEILDELGEIGEAGKEDIIDVAGGIISVYDKVADLVDWAVGRTFILVARRLHEGRVKLHRHRRDIVKVGLGALVAATAVTALFASITDYEYAYNGRTLGIVREQQDVIEILDMVSEELTQEYGSSITIDPETDITFTPVISYGKEIDDADTVLKRFTYMGDIQTKAYAVYADGELLAVMESKKTAEDMLNRILEDYLDNDDVEYEYVGFAENIQIKPYNTTLSKVTSSAAAYKKIKNGGQQEITYEVVAGDTLSGICEKLGVSLDELKDMNPGLSENDTLHVGDSFVITEEVPLLTVETVEVATYAEKVKYETKYKKSDNYFEGEKVVSQEGKNGKARVTARLTKHNGKTVEKEILSTKIIQEPVDKIILKGTKEKPPTAGSGKFIRPVNVSVYSGYGWRWGRMHYGIDLSCATGTPIHAADGGVVTTAGWYYGYGLTVIIDHGNGYTTLYGHCSALYVSVGEHVYQGQTIAAVGNTGNSSGPHCHFEIKHNGANVNPSNYV